MKTIIERKIQSKLINKVNLIVNLKKDTNSIYYAIKYQSAFVYELFAPGIILLNPTQHTIVSDYTHYEFDFKHHTVQIDCSVLPTVACTTDRLYLYLRGRNIYRNNMVTQLCFKSKIVCQGIRKHICDDRDAAYNTLLHTFKCLKDLFIAIQQNKILIKDIHKASINLQIPYNIENVYQDTEHNFYI